MVWWLDHWNYFNLLVLLVITLLFSCNLHYKHPLSATFVYWNPSYPNHTSRFAVDISALDVLSPSLSQLSGRRRAIGEDSPAHVTQRLPLFVCVRQRESFINSSDSRTSLPLFFAHTYFHTENGTTHLTAPQAPILERRDTAEQRSMLGDSRRTKDPLACLILNASAAHTLPHARRSHS